MARVPFPRFHLTEIEDTNWCPSWLRDHAHASLARLWQIKSSRHFLATQASDILLERLGSISSAAKYTFEDSCAGTGGPIPYFEKYINKQLEACGHTPVQFVLMDWAPYVQAWEALAVQSADISYVPEPIDASKAVRIAEPDRKECRIFNLCFHHFDDPEVEEVLRCAVETADAFL
ncbi:hypothetical protein ZTR_04431 [Talaromyces verruculosus]|nr:hypothetical protein ZTR_04431 [Talaromyces verruculosus]